MRPGTEADAESDTYPAANYASHAAYESSTDVTSYTFAYAYAETVVPALPEDACSRLAMLATPKQAKAGRGVGTRSRYCCGTECRSDSAVATALL